MWAAIIAFIIQLITTLFKKTASAVTYVYDAIRSSGAGVATSIVDWFNDDEVSIKSKLLGVAGAAYLVAPETTSDVISSAIGGVATTASSAVESSSDVVDSFFSSSWFKVVLIAGGCILGYKLLTD